MCSVQMDKRANGQLSKWTKRQMNNWTNGEMGKTYFELQNAKDSIFCEKKKERKTELTLTNTIQDGRVIVIFTMRE